jgi:hypothetical protein
VPAAAVIPAPIAYIKVVAVKKLVVGFLAVLVVSVFQKGCVYATSRSTFLDVRGALD